jgi:hypothetical protein
LLAAMARHKVLRQVERLRAARREGSRALHEAAGEGEPTDPRPGPHRVVAGRELLQQFAAGCPRRNGGWQTSAPWVDRGPISPPRSGAIPMPYACD